MIDAEKLGPSLNWVAQVNAFARPPAPRQRCELCALPLAEGHAHLVEPATRRMVCACTACALLFERGETGALRRVPSRGRYLGELGLAEEDWLALGVPIDIAFFSESSAQGGALATYPGAAGPVVSPIDAPLWARLKAAVPGLAPDVEALLVNRMDGKREAYRLPIDRCYALAGLIRQHWRGLSGGTEVWRVIRRYFEALRRDLQVKESG